MLKQNVLPDQFKNGEQKNIFIFMANSGTIFENNLYLCSTNENSIK